ncbi:alpha/beta hydrolase [Streptomyces sp. CB01881]|uniref:alpha/beta hydrolase n=1 Tax=Streptomyces sp. CB01881 TaxID=2078691 RepID=UPI000CDC6627|nr:alpha/beta hydrolase [Streptomyces sp. CB01881]AUY47990.1 alpha/beta hydrolase [Streptomyces sp. CB01881]TYC76471.1 alpha/beta hydrolase [Streptomyces sp. CB01881]
MPLHPQAQALRERRAQAGTPPLYTLTPAQARAADLADIRAAAGTPEPVAAVEEHRIPGPAGELTLRLYRPEQAGGAALPALLYLFGGGWTLGSPDTSDAICRRLTNAVGCVTASVGYRLAPEHPFPAAVHDCRAAAHWLAGHAADLGIDPQRLAVGGDSAGGNLAAALTLLARDEGGPALRHQLLVYPNTDHRADTASLREHDDPALFNRRSVAWYWGHYLADPADGDHPHASPLRAPSLAGLPPATVITAEYDPLRDEGEHYAEALRAAGVVVESRRYAGMPHGFFAMTGVLDAAAAAQQYAAERLREALR